MTQRGQNLSNELCTLIVRDCRVPSVHYRTWGSSRTGRNLHNLDRGDSGSGRHIANRGHAFGEDLFRAVGATSAASANAKRLGQLIHGRNAKMGSAVNLVIGDLIADADVHNLLLGGLRDTGMSARLRKINRDRK
jgi:hypothetical protein